MRNRQESDGAPTSEDAMAATPAARPTAAAEGFGVDSWHAVDGTPGELVALSTTRSGDLEVPVVFRLSGFDPATTVTRALPGTPAADDPTNWLSGHDHIDAVAFMSGGGAREEDMAFLEMRDEEATFEWWKTLKETHEIARGAGTAAEAAIFDMAVIRCFRAVQTDEEGRPVNAPRLELVAVARTYRHYPRATPTRRERLRLLMEDSGPAVRAQAARLAAARDSG